MLQKGSARRGLGQRLRGVQRSCQSGVGLIALPPTVRAPPRRKWLTSHCMGPSPSFTALHI